MKSKIEEMWSRHGSYRYDQYVAKTFGWRLGLISTIEWRETPTKKMTLGKMIFLASVTHGWLPLHTMLQSRGNMATSRCLVCAQEDEDMEHFMFCKRYKTKWRRGLEEAIERVGEEYGTSSNIKEILKVSMSRKVFREKGWSLAVH